MVSNHKIAGSGLLLSKNTINYNEVHLIYSVLVNKLSVGFFSHPVI